MAEQGSAAVVADIAAEVDRDIEAELRAMNIHQRIHAVMLEIDGHLEKDKHVEIKGKLAYEYISHDAVTQYIRPALVKWRIMVLPSILERRDSGNRCELDVSVRFVNIDDPENFVDITVAGYGADPSDKGPGKAFSYACKYAYLKLFMINSGDDIELEDVAHDSGTATQADVDVQRDKSRAVMETWANNFRDLIDSAGSAARLNEVVKLNKAALDSAPDSTRDFFNARIGTVKQRLIDEEAMEANDE